MIRQSPGFDSEISSEITKVHRCTVPRTRKKKLVFTSPRFSNRDGDIFVRNDNLFDSAKRWGCISEQAGDHRQSGRILVLHRSMDPESLLYGMTREASLRVRSLSLVVDEKEHGLEKWVNIISATLINLENLSIVDSQFKDLSLTRRMQRSFILQMMPNLRSIDEISITPEERFFSQNRSSIGSEVLDCDDDDETSPHDIPSCLSFDHNEDSDRSIEIGSMAKQLNEDKNAFCSTIEKSKCNKSGDKKLQSSIIENADEQNDCSNLLPEASSARQSAQCNSNVLHCFGGAVVEYKKDDLDVESVASSHIEWTACGILTFRSDNVCVPDVRLPFCGSPTRSTYEEDDQRLRARAKQRSQRKMKSSPSVCTPVPRQVSGSLFAVGNQPFVDGSRCETKFFPSDDDLIEEGEVSVLMDQNKNAPVKHQFDGAKIDGRGKVVEIIPQPLPLVRMHGYKDIHQPNTQNSVGRCIQETALALHSRHHILSSSKENCSMFDRIYDDDETEDGDEIIMDADSNEIGWKLGAFVRLD